jgi:hypothetical protein
MKFKIGDLVTLSAKGRQIGQNKAVLEGFGMVVEVKSRPRRPTDYPIKCQWYGPHKSGMRFKEYELKFYRGEQ